MFADRGRSHRARNNSAIVSVYADGQPIIRSVTLNGVVTIGPGRIVASNTTLRIDIANERKTGTGDDFGITDIRVRRVA
ncbi:hypothetical protein [Xanthomonas sp. NCPPB 2632]|jgi:hypothetical protein|uniref:hypothetical protein n=1 Tax=Xanthomonas sp. NCPPB 2632 TaxID=3240912 RepID=UPI0035119D9B